MPHNNLEERKAYHKAYFQKHKDSWKRGEWKSEYGRTYKQKNKTSVTIKYLKARAKKKNVPFNLEETDIVVPEFCPILGIKLESNIGKGSAKANSPSVDRIVPELGYVKGNIMVISYLANMMKSNATPEQLIKFSEWIRKTYV